jgi:hypothetical protein
MKFFLTLLLLCLPAVAQDTGRPVPTRAWSRAFLVQNTAADGLSYLGGGAGGGNFATNSSGNATFVGFTTFQKGSVTPLRVIENTTNTSTWALTTNDFNVIFRISTGTGPDLARLPADAPVGFPLLLSQDQFDQNGIDITNTVGNINGFPPGAGLSSFSLLPTLGNTHWILIVKSESTNWNICSYYTSQP